jgi:hypothetical protein
MELAFIEEEIPKITRVGGSGREPEPWEDHIAPLKDDDKAGKSFRVWTYSKRPSAVSRMSSVRDRLTKAVPSENWQLAVRMVPGTENEFGVYVSYLGAFTNEQVVENARKHQERSARVKAARAATQASAPTDSTSAEPTGTTAKERVAAARQKQTA